MNKDRKEMNKTRQESFCTCAAWYKSGVRVEAHLAPLPGCQAPPTGIPPDRSPWWIHLCLVAVKGSQSLIVGHTLPSLSPGSSPPSSLPGPATIIKKPSRTTYKHPLHPPSISDYYTIIPEDLEVPSSTRPAPLPLENHIRSPWRRIPCRSHSGS